jgi:23S rRNA (uridine2479-2'-O)-methyltransferase
MAKILKITKENAMFQMIAALKTNRDKRNKMGFLVEGVRNINNAIKYRWGITTYLYSSERGLSDWGKTIIAASTADTHYDLSKDLLKQLSDKDEPSELLAIANMPIDDLNRIQLRKNPLIVIFDSPSLPGNLGTLIRSCDALGADGLVITGYATDVYDPETLRAATGSVFSLPIVRMPASKDLLPGIETLRAKYPNLKIVGTDEKGTKQVFEHDFTKPTIILAGNEKRGLSAAYKEMADVMVNIPMAGTGSASSLNVAVATSIVLAEVGRQRAIK